MSTKHLVKKKEKIRKYKLEECMNNLTVKEHKIMRKLIPDLIGKCINTFNNYRDITIDAKDEIPYPVAIILEDLFGLKPRSICNINVKCDHYKDLIKEFELNKAAEEIK